VPEVQRKTVCPFVAGERERVKENSGGLEMTVNGSQIEDFGGEVERSSPR